MKKCITLFALAFLLCSAASAETFVVSRNGAEVSAMRDGKAWTAKSELDPKDSTQVLAAFFESFFSQTEEWYYLIWHWSIPGSSFDEGIVRMRDDYEAFYGRADSISVTIAPEKFTDNGYGSASFTVRIAYTYKGESGEGEDQVAMRKDETCGWVVVELPR